MKKLVLLVATITSVVSANAQFPTMYDHIDINNIKAEVNSDGTLFWNLATGQFEVPKGSGVHTIFANALWIGGVDASSTLKIAGQTYRQTGTDFWPGPLSSMATTDSATMNAYNKIWKINKCDIDTYINWFTSGASGTNPTDSTAMQTILDWPTTGIAGAPLAPYADVNGNGVYDPYAGDYPLIKGDQALFFVYNDKGGVHGETGGAAIGLEIQGMAYAYSCTNDSALYNTIFTNYKIINKSSSTLYSTYIGNWTDLDIGSASDDFVGCDVTRGAYYGYNGDLVDDNPPAGQLAYGANPPAQAVVFLEGPYADPNGIDDASTTTPNGTNYGDMIADNERLGMSKFLYFNNDGSSTGNPSSAVDFYNYLSGNWKDATPWTYGGNGHLTGVQTDYIFPGASDPLGFGTAMVPQAPWDETSSGNMPGDRRGIGSFGPFTFQPGLVEDITFAYVFGRATSGGNLASVTVMDERIDSIRQKYSNGIATCGCVSMTGINDLSNDNSLSIYPNPASNNITINFTSSSKNVSIKIYDTTGRLVKNIDNAKAGESSINIAELESGLYLLNLQDGNNSTTKRFIKQ